MKIVGLGYNAPAKQRVVQEGAKGEEKGIEARYCNLKTYKF